MPAITEVVGGGAGLHTRILREPGPSYGHSQMGVVASGAGGTEQRVLPRGGGGK